MNDKPRITVSIQDINKNGANGKIRAKLNKAPEDVFTVVLDEGKFIHNGVEYDVYDPDDPVDTKSLGWVK